MTCGPIGIDEGYTLSSRTLRVMTADLIALVVTAVQRGAIALELQVTPEGGVLVRRSYGNQAFAQETYELADYPSICPLCLVEQLMCLLIYSEEQGQELILDFRGELGRNVPHKIEMRYVNGGWAARLVALPADQLYRTPLCAHHA